MNGGRPSAAVETRLGRLSVPGVFVASGCGSLWILALWKLFDEQANGVPCARGSMTARARTYDCWSC